MKKYILVVAAGLALAGTSFASDTLVLTDAEMDNVAAGGGWGGWCGCPSVVSIHQGGMSYGHAGTNSSSSGMAYSDGYVQLSVVAGYTNGYSRGYGSHETFQVFSAN